MLRRDLPHRFFAGKRYSEDYLLWCEILLDGYACYLSPLPLAFMFKADYGEAGLSGNLWAMENVTFPFTSAFFDASSHTWR